MKLIFLATLLYLAAEWPTPSVCWPATMNQQYGGGMDTSSLSAILGQQMLSNQMNGYGMNTLMGNGGGLGRFNPDLMQAFGAMGNNEQQQQQRAAFSRLGAHGKNKKLSNTKFMLKPTAVVEETPIEEAIEQFEQEIAPVQTIKQQTPAAADAAVEKKTEQVETEKPTATVAKVEEEQQKQHVESKETAASESSSSKQTDDLVQKIQQQQQKQQNLETKPESNAAAEKKDSAAVNEHPAVKAVQEQDLSEFHAPAHAAYTAPFTPEATLTASPSESVRMLNGRQRVQQQQQQPHQQQFGQFYNEQQQFQQQQQQQQSKPLKFKMATPDNVHNVGLGSIQNEMTRVLSSRKYSGDSSNDDSQPQRPAYTSPYFNQPSYANNLYGTNGYASPYGGYNVPVPNPTPSSNYAANNAGEAVSSQSFSSLIIIVNSNANSNLGVTIIDVDLLRSFLSRYIGKSIEEVLKDGSLEDKVKDFNRDREKSSSSSKSDKEGSGKSSSKGKYESTSKLSANIPTYSSDDSVDPDSHSESTVLLRKNGGGYSSVDKNPYAYSYVPYQNGGLIVINNVNDNYNKAVKSVLSGRGKSINKNDAFVLPLPPIEIKRLMEDAIIVSNNNTNTNLH